MFVVVDFIFAVWSRVCRQGGEGLRTLFSLLSLGKCSRGWELSIVCCFQRMTGESCIRIRVSVQFLVAYVLFFG